MKITNRRARHDYHIAERLEAGIVLTGAEVKAVRAKKVDFLSSYAKPIGGEMFLLNLHIGAEDKADTRRTRKLLLNKKEIIGIQTKIKSRKLTAIPLSLYTKGRKVKLDLGLARGKRKHEKRGQLKKRDIDREIDKELSSRT
jgi:SsrA-binding protein